jgi:DNA polymerase-3 subunit epsilon
VEDGEGGWRPELVRGPDLDPGRQDKLFGFFTSKTAATKALRTLAEEHALCQVCLGLKKHAAASPSATRSSAARGPASEPSPAACTAPA